jgi:nicotinate phosphoribosyltransferase
MRYGLHPVGTMAHSYVLSFESEEAAFRAFMEDHPDNALMLVDTYDTAEGVHRAIAASQGTGVRLTGVRIDSGDLLTLSREARQALDRAGMEEARIVASGDLEEGRIAELVAAGAPIDDWGVGTDLGTSRDSPVLNGVYKLVADRAADGWRGVAKSSEGKATVAGAKQVFRHFRDGEMTDDVIAADEEQIEGEPLLVPAMRDGRIVLEESLDQMRARTERSLRMLPATLRRGDVEAPYPVSYSPGLLGER